MDFIVLDEFYRSGARMWGQGVQNMLNGVHEIPVLGLSATAICYLDNQRDMEANCSTAMWLPKWLW